MPVSFTRVDDRLIHGQIVQGWLPGMKIDELVVVLEHADSLSKNLMRLALPPEYGLKVLNVRAAADYVKHSSSRIFLLFESLDSLGQAVKEGINFKSINIGGLHYREGRDKILTDVYLTPQERGFVKNLINSGVDIDGRSVPKEPHADLKDILCS
ncbi:MAG: PTS sugar transporter subunit IIB [Elusimicrobium sp.]|jgi:mannose/fructose/N-acetylgalactosamine-specific phosphotransferase system component IIB|nr:PTS sugar transporter subunit IIB [Elusimicrobium sp.]